MAFFDQIFDDNFLNEIYQNIQHKQQLFESDYRINLTNKYNILNFFNMIFSTNIQPCDVIDPKKNKILMINYQNIMAKYYFSRLPQTTVNKFYHIVKKSRNDVIKILSMDSYEISYAILKASYENNIKKIKLESGIFFIQQCRTEKKWFFFDEIISLNEINQNNLQSFIYP